MRRTGARWAVLFGTAIGLVVLVAGPAGAQQPEFSRRWELRGSQFDFSQDGVWRRRARAVAEQRAAALGRGDFALLNAPRRLTGPVPSAMAISGTLKVPAILFRFANPPASQIDSAQYTQYLFGATPPALRPYTLRTLYEQWSNGGFSMQGNAIGWVTLANAEATYTGPTTGCPSPLGLCNGVWDGPSFAAMQAGLREAVGLADPLVNFGLYDNDGPDLVPNSGDDDGYVDLVVFAHPEMDGACLQAGNNHIWAHRSSLGGVATTDLWTGHGSLTVRVRDYIVQSGVGGATSCDISQIMPIGTIAHETGHGLGLPDLYDTNSGDGDDSEGIGGWGLMGSGNYYRPLSPSAFEAWSRARLGWVTVRQLSTSGVYTFGPSALGDSVFLVRPTGSNPRNEYFLLENRQGVQSDSALIAMRAPGLLVWHMDSTQIVNRWSANTINSGYPHGVVLVEANGPPYHLLSSTSGVRNRGDDKDPFPGSTNTTSLYPTAGDAAMLYDGTPPGFVLDSIAQLAPQGAMRFRIAFGGNLAVAASDTTAKVRVRGQTTGRFRQFLMAGDTATVELDSLQVNPAGTTQYAFVRWSDGGARSHRVTTGQRDSTITATVTRRFDVRWTVAGPGSVTAAPSLPATGSFVAEGDSVVLLARPSANGVFMGWGGDVSSLGLRLTVSATQAYNVTASFTVAPLDSVVGHLLHGTGLTLQQATMLDNTGNHNGRFDLGDFVAWLDQSGTTISAELMARIFARARQ
ncbi:MAG: M6 family metalloprotease domain-containing protein [Gemmatimonadota bacterium]